MKAAQPATTVICTVGTSLFFPNLVNLKPDDPNPIRASLAVAYARKDWEQVARELRELPSTERTCGAEINSMAGLFAGGYADRDCNLIFPVSATPDGQAVGRILEFYYRSQGHPVAEAQEIPGLQDQDPRAFRTQGLRNLAKAICRTVRDYGASSCAINATGGYKAQIAVAVLIGQALGAPVYYKHERFQDHDIIAFPPIPVAFDYSLWMRNRGLLAVVERDPQPADWFDQASDDSEALETLISRVEIDGAEYLELSATGQIFLETFRDRFRRDQLLLLPPAIPDHEKRPPHLEKSGHMKDVKGLVEYLEALTREVPQVQRCRTFYIHPDLPGEPLFRLGSHGVEGWYRDGKALVKFGVESRATTEEQKAALVARLSQWIEER